MTAIGWLKKVIWDPPLWWLYVCKCKGFNTKLIKIYNLKWYFEVFLYVYHSDTWHIICLLQDDVSWQFWKKKKIFVYLC